MHLIADDRDVLLQAHALAELGTWVWDVQEDEIHWSRELYRLFGIAPQSAPLRLDSFIRFVHPEDRQRFATALGFAAASGAPFDHDFRVITARGQVRVISGRGSVIMDGRGFAERIIGTTLDITDRAQAELALQRSEERFRGVFEQSPNGIAIFDGECALAQVNPAFARFLGYQPAELTGRRLEEITHLEDHPAVNPCFRGTFTSDARYVCNDGNIVWGRTTLTPLHGDLGQRVGYMAVVEDITAKKQSAEAELRQAELMRTVLDHIPMMVVMADAHGRARFVNREFERVFGWSAAEASRMDLFQAVYPDAVERTHAIEAIRRADASWKEYEPTNRGGARVRSVWACVALPDETIICMGRVGAGTGFERDLLAPTASSLLQLGVPRAELPS